MGLAYRTITRISWKLLGVALLGWPISGHAQSAPPSSAALPPPPPDQPASEPSAEPPPAPSAPPSNAPPAPPPTATPPPPGYTAPAYVGPYAQPTYPPAPAPYAEPPLPPEPPPDHHAVSITISPLHLLVGPIVELEAEFKVADHVGAAAIGGYGELSVTTPDANGNLYETKFTAFELGAQLNWYPSKPFKGLDVGAELMYLKIDTDSVAETEFSGLGVGLAVGPLIGYKVLTSGGFTFVVQGGFSYLAVKAEVKDPNGTSSTANDTTLLLNLNLNLGWSF